MFHPVQNQPAPAFGQRPLARFGMTQPESSERENASGNSGELAATASAAKAETPGDSIELQQSQENALASATPEVSEEDKKAQRQHNRRVAKSVLFKTVLPLASIGLWFIPGIGIPAGMGVSYVSGRIARRIDNKINEEQLSGTARKTRELMNALSDPASLKDNEDVVNKVNGVLDEALEPSKLAAVPLIGGLLAKSGGFLSSLRLPYNGTVAKALSGYVQVKRAKALGGAATAGAAAKTMTARAFFLLNAAGANHAVAQAAAKENSNFSALPKAAWAGVSHLLLIKFLPGLLSKLTGSSNGLLKWVGQQATKLSEQSVK